MIVTEILAEHPTSFTGSVSNVHNVDRLRERLAQVLDPELGASIVELGMVGDIDVSGRRAVVHVALTTVGCPLRSQIERDVREAALTLDDIDTVELVMASWMPKPRRHS